MATLEILGHDCTLGAQLGAGGMGQVFAADHPVAGPLAVKLLQDQLLGEPLFVERVANEGCAAARVRHENVVRVIDHGMTSAGVPFVAMERVAGMSLLSLIQREGLLSLPRIRTLAAQVLAGLAAIHRAGLVHADLKSDNLLVDGDRLTIIDFGLAREACCADRHLISGTPEYMAPELIRGDVITFAADLYAVGVILYELLTGTTPFGGGSAAEIFDRHLHDEVVPPSKRCPDRAIPRALDELVVRALAKKPQDRFTDADELLEALLEAIDEECDSDVVATTQMFSISGPTREWARLDLQPTPTTALLAV
ncbi:MAG: serine/threonine-protein kinase [Deltaproteobacteria bacterium]